MWAPEIDSLRKRKVNSSARQAGRFVTHDHKAGRRLANQRQQQQQQHIKREATPTKGRPAQTTKFVSCLGRRQLAVAAARK
jgi:hypothetical protein